MSEEFLFQVKELVKNKISASINNTNIIEKSMRYSALSDSKMIRAGLIFASSEINKNLSQESVVSLAAAVELMHTYSLIHDDLPCMDDDSLRRGQPSNHIKFGEANAVLAGDALQALAYEIICDDNELSDSEKVYAMKILSQSCGKNGMVLGQQLDIENENNSEPIDQKKLDHIHNLKTGKLIECSVMLGQIRSEINEHDKNVLKDFSRKIGLAFQITDDILEVTQSQEMLGKNKDSDIKNNKLSYVRAVGLDEAIDIAKSLTSNALLKIDKSGIENKESIVNLAKYLVDREY